MTLDEREKNTKQTQFRTTHRQSMGYVGTLVPRGVRLSKT